MKVFKFILIGMVILSCRKNINSLEKKAKYQADSLFQLEYPLVNNSLDSLCNLKKQNRMHVLLDSVVEIRKQEIIELQKGL